MSGLAKVLVAATIVGGLALVSCGSQGKETDCRNGVDDDKNGAADCLDPACATDLSCLNIDAGNEVFTPCTVQQDCLDAGWIIDRPLRACKGARCEAQGTPVAVRLEADTAAFAGAPQSFRSMSTRFSTLR